MINDASGTTLASASTLDPEIRAQQAYGGNKAAASVVGRVVAERAKQAGIDKICFDRRSYKYHGRVQALAEAAREAGLAILTASRRRSRSACIRGIDDH